VYGGPSLPENHCIAGISSFLSLGVAFAGIALSAAEPRYLDTKIYCITDKYYQEVEHVGTHSGYCRHIRRRSLEL